MSLNCTILSFPGETIRQMLANDEDGDDMAEPVAELDLERCWHALHFLISGETDSASAPSAMLLSGQQMEGVSEHCKLHTAEAVAAFANVLSQIAPADFISRVDSCEPTGKDIYDFYRKSDFESSKSTLLEHYQDLREFIESLAAENLGALVTIL